MAINAAKQLLDELMGRERDLAPNEKRSSLSWNDPSVCKHALVKFCPNSLFVNTKADIGPCHLVHDDYLKREYEKQATRREQRQYEDEFIKFCQSHLTDVERKIKRAKQRLELSQVEKDNLTNSSFILSEENQEKIQKITEKIEKLLQQIQQLGCEGKVEEAQDAMKEVDQLKEERTLIKRENQSGHWIQQKAEIGVAQEKQMEVCDVCGAFLIVNDVQQRVDDHLMGKQHVGFGRLKTALDEIFQRRKNEEIELSKKDYKNGSDSKYSNRDGGDRYHRRNDRSSQHRFDHRSNRYSSDSRRDHHRSSSLSSSSKTSSHRHQQRYKERSRSRSRSPSEKSSSSSFHRKSSKTDRTSSSSSSSHRQSKNGTKN